MRRMRLKQWLLLLLRTLAIAALVFSFARPTLTGQLAGNIGQKASHAYAIVLDNSRSMELRDSKGDYIVQAKKLAKELVDQMEGGDELSIYTTAGSDPALALPFSSQPLARDAVDQITTSGGSKSLGSLVNQIQGKLSESTRPNRSIFVISDLQESTFSDSLIASIEEDASLTLIPVGSDPPENIAIESVVVNSRIVEMDQPVKVQIGIRNHGTTNIDDLILSAYLDEERVGQANSNLSSQGYAVVDLTLTPKKRGWLSGLIEIESDIFESDNSRHFVLHVPERRKILLVEGDAEDATFVDLALSADLTGGRIAFDISRVSENRLPATELGEFDAVILLGLSSISSGEISNLNSFMQNGGGLVIFPGSAADKSGVNDLLSRIGGGAFTTSLNQAGEAVASLGQTDFEHPIFLGMFANENQTTIQMENIDLFRLVNYQIRGGNEQTIVKLKSSAPFLQEIRSESGRALVFSSMPDPNWSDLPVRGLFVPLMYRSLFYVSSGQSGEKLDIELGIPEQRKLPGASLIEVPGNLTEAGIYDFLSAEQIVSRVAVNNSLKESNLNRLAPDRAQEILSGLTSGEVKVLSNVNSDEDLRQSLQEARLGVEVWNVFLAIALILLLIEMLVSVRWKEPKVEAEVA